MRALTLEPEVLRGVAPARLGRRCLLGALAVLALAQLWLEATGNQYGYDFRGGTWNAGRALLQGRSPYPAPVVHALLAHSNSFITPPPLALLGAPFSLLPFGAAIVAFNLLCAGCLLAALRLLGVRDRATLLVALSTFPFIASLCLGQPDGVFCLGAAVAWRWRDRWPGALGGGAIIAAKLLGAPLVLWLLVTRRFRQAALTAGAAGLVLLVSWAAVGFAGLTSYPRLLRADATAFGARSHSIFAALVSLGLGHPVASVLAVLLAAGVAAVVVRAGRGGDLAWFTAALALGILSSPVVWQHYLLLLFVPLAATGRARDPLAWLLAALLWLAPSESPLSLAQAILIPGLAAGLAVRVAWLSRSAPAA